MRMLKHLRKVLVLSMAFTVAPVSAERLLDPVSQGSECPYERARLAAAAQQEATPIIDAGLPGGSMLGRAQSSFFAP
jgi:hypothetical protein